MGFLNKISKSVKFESFSIPNETLELLWFEKSDTSLIKKSKSHFGRLYDFSGLNVTYSGPGDEEPSIIYRKEKIKGCQDVEKLPYFPTYHDMDSCQKYKYLEWLEDITKQIEIGYVFLFYYGLERYLMTDKYQEAILKIDQLRKYHDKGSFRGYSSDGIIMSCYINDRLDMFEKLTVPLQKTELYYFVKLMRTGYLSFEDIFHASYLLKLKNRRYINGYPDLFMESLKKVTMNKYGETFMSVNQSELIESPEKLISGFANLSLRKDLGEFKIYDIFSNEKVRSEMLNLLSLAHEGVKENLKELRKCGDEPKRANKKVKDNKQINSADFKKGEKKVLAQIKEAKSIVDRHFAYMATSDFYYKYRTENIMLKQAKEFAKKDIDLFPELHHQIVLEIGAVPRYPTFERLAVIYEKEGNLQKSLETLFFALKFVNEKQKLNVQKKIEKYQSEL